MNFASSGVQTPQRILGTEAPSETNPAFRVKSFPQNCRASSSNVLNLVARSASS